MNVAEIGRVIEVLEDMRQCSVIGKYAVGGAVAAILYDEPISTVDLDIFFISAKPSTALILDMGPIYDYCRERGFSFDHEFIDIFGWLVQFVEASNKQLWLDGINNSRFLRVGDVDVPVVGPEYLLAMWLLAGREKDFDKIGRFLHGELVDTAEFLRLVKKFGLKSEWNTAKHRFIDED